MRENIRFRYQPPSMDEPEWTEPDRLHPAFKSFFRENRMASEKYVRDLPLRKRWLSTHAFHPSADTCMHGGLTKIGRTIDVPAGILETFRSEGSKNSLRNFMYAQRTQESVRRSSAVHIEGTVYDLAEMRFVTAHWSASHPSTASCAAWKHQTDEALAAMQEHAHELNFCWKGRMVAFPVLIDTDLDALEIFGPGPPYSVRQLLEDLGPDRPPDKESIADVLRVTFRADWPPLAALQPVHRSAFHLELAERVVANLLHVRNVFRSIRPVELKEGAERMIFIGRHADWIESHNVVFLIDDTEERETVRSSFRTALPRVAKIAIADAAATEDQNWIVPVVVNVPYNEPEDDRLVAVQYVRYLVDDLKAAIQQDKSSLFGLFGPNGIKSDRIPAWLLQQVTGIADRIRIVMSVSRRKTRLFEPFT